MSQSLESSSWDEQDTEPHRLSLKINFQSFDEDYYKTSEISSEVLDATKLPKVWPLCGRWKDHDQAGCFHLHSGLKMYLANPECQQAVEASAFQEWLESYGIITQIATRTSDADVLVYIKTTLCSQPESFELQIRSNRVILIANDFHGVMYGLQALKQLIVNSGEEENTEEHGRAIRLSPLLLSSKPAVARRAVMWSYQYNVFAARENVATSIRMLSNLCINNLLLVLDGSLDLDFSGDFGRKFQADLQDIQELCQRFKITLIPTILIESPIDWEIGSRALKLHSHQSICLVFNYTATNLVKDMNNGDIAADICAQHVRGIMSDVKQQGFKSVAISRNRFVNDATSNDKSLFDACEEWEYDHILPASLMYKPIIFMKDFLDAMHSLVSCPNASIVVFPSVHESDFLCPDILLKFYLALFANAAYYGAKAFSVLDAASLSRQLESVLAIILPSFRQIAQHLQEAILSILNWKKATTTEGSVGNNTSERAMWSLFLMSDSVQNPELPNQDEALRCFRTYRTLLNQARYKPSTQKMLQNRFTRTHERSQSLSEVDELFASIDVLCMISRTIYLATSFSSSPKDQRDSAAAALVETQNPQQKRAAVYDNVDMSKPYAPKVCPKTEAISQMLIKVVQQNVLFRNFKSEEHARIVDAFEPISAKAGEIVIKQGDSGEYFYIIESGKLDVYMESSGLRIKVGRTLTESDYFGELALMYNTPRAATVISTEGSVLWRIDRQTYRTIVTHHNKETSDEFFGLVCNVHILGKRLGDVLSHAELNKVVSTLEVEEFEDGNVIIRQNQTGDYFYIISEGQVHVWQETSDTGTKTLFGNQVATLSRGNYFGEKALLADDVRQASCVAVGKVICLSLSRDDFIAMIGSWQDITDVKNIQGVAAKQRKIRASVYDSQYHVNIDLEELERLNVLGVGAFGKVQVARHKESGQLYALKSQAKSFIVSQNMQEMVLNEMHIMKQLDHPFISKLHASMQDRKYIYFLLELLPGGEFFSFLQLAGKLSEDRCRFYSAAVILALEELHKTKIAFRDLKPENMVMDARGYVKLVDFGLAKQVITGSTWTMCGTPDYLAPEIILNKGHNHAVDYWALGVLIFEMIHGWPPFYHDSPMKVYEKIISGKVNYPETFSKNLEDIIAKFLVNNPSKRLGNMKGGVADIIKHKWFGSFDWQGLLAGTLMAPSIPNLSTFDAALAAAEDDDDNENNEEHEESDWNPDLC